MEVIEFVYGQGKFFFYLKISYNYTCILTRGFTFWGPTSPRLAYAQSAKYMYLSYIKTVGSIS